MWRDCSLALVAPARSKPSGNTNIETAIRAGFRLLHNSTVMGVGAGCARTLLLISDTVGTAGPYKCVSLLEALGFLMISSVLWPNALAY
jgi:hypothetical protein